MCCAVLCCVLTWSQQQEEDEEEGGVVGLGVENGNRFVALNSSIQKGNGAECIHGAS